MYGEFMAGMVDDFNLVDTLAAPTLPVKYPRGELIRPSAAENRYNAWYWKCTIQGAAAASSKANASPSKTISASPESR